jgi:hypothetical protein
MRFVTFFLVTRSHEGPIAAEAVSHIVSSVGKVESTERGWCLNAWSVTSTSPYALMVGWGWPHVQRVSTFFINI